MRLRAAYTKLKPSKTLPNVSMTTIHLVTRNNAPTIQRALDSVRFADRILIADLGSQDETVALCKQPKVEIYSLKMARAQARAELAKKSQGLNLWLEPWEAVIQGQMPSQNSYVQILQQKSVAKEIRVWTGDAIIVNPVFERLEIPAGESNLILHSSGRSDYEELLQEIVNWKINAPTASAPYYYEACCLLSLGRLDEFMSVAERYLFLDHSASMSATMLRYYYAMICVTHAKKVRPALQNISLCLAVKPLAAEFWCLLGDVYYHLLMKFEQAKVFYENAMFLGARRLKDDKWPLDITKYKAYPLKMIESCDAISSSKSFYVPSRQ
jgi:tetratricopeptide (TPR) repeat protein